MTKAAELVELDDDELQNRLAGARRELLNLRFQLATGQLDNTERLREVKKDIARALTILRARDLSELDVELEPLVLTPVRRLPIDESGGVDETVEDEEDEEVEEEEEGEEEAGEDAGGEEALQDAPEDGFGAEAFDAEEEPGGAEASGDLEATGDDAADEEDGQ
jgi:large subunit ribosomal protein L29